MKKALVIGASGGIGNAVVQELRRRGMYVDGISRSEHGLDYTDESSVERVLTGLSGPYDLVLVATGALEIEGSKPEKALRQLSSDTMMRQFMINTVGPAMVIKHAVRLLAAKEPATIAVLSARVGSIGDNHLGGWYSYRAAKAALNQVIRTASIELGRTHPNAICVALHPGTVDTKLTRMYAARHPTVPAEKAAANLIDVLDGLSRQHSGKFYDWAGIEVEW